VERYICIHGHFYQPPRENPWLEAIEHQDSAFPYHDWNERITAECYAPNAVSRILDGQNRIVKLINNYAKISFNFGPTLLNWLQAKAPDVYEAILEADRASLENFSGHGSALAQAYNHMILPLANRRDKRTQILWGIRDFERRFGRRPEGLWLPETAVDLESLEIVAELGIRFTILAPYQASRVRKIGARNWRDVSGGRIDPTMAYEHHLPSRRKIALFFYDGPVSRAVAFEGALRKGEDFAHRLVDAFNEERDWPQLVHIATDGESYGHHHRFGDMALAYALHYIESNQLARLTNYGEYLERHPPTHQVETFENTSWSCAHGVVRWWGDCGCNSGGHQGWSQAWRTPLREALDWLRDALSPRYEEKARQLLKDPWEARDEYIEVILDRSAENIERFLGRRAVRALDEAEKITALKLLELQRHLMLMYTSCGWFFDELSGIETVQVIHYAGRAVQLGEELFGDSIESQFTERLGKAQSNVPEHGDGGQIYEKSVKPAMVDWERAGAHYAVSSLFESYPEQARIYCYTAKREDYHSFEAGKARLVIGSVQLTSEITRESSVLSFGVLHFGDHNLNGGVRKFLGQDAYRSLVHDAAEPFARAEFPEVIRLMDREFGESNYSIRSLFREEQRRVLNRILESTLAEAEALYKQIYENHAPMMRFLTGLRIPLPGALHAAAEFVLNVQLRRALESEEIDTQRVGILLETTKVEGVSLDPAALEYAFRKNLERMAEQFLGQPADLSLLQRLEAVADLLWKLPFAVDTWKIQNIYYKILEKVYPEAREKAERGEEISQAWTSHFRALGDKLKVLVG
jgi:alpha-amylase/alpha-mannosidase (GH57 family)